MLGVVLCGGQSTRMGSDKGLLKHKSKTWVQIAVGKLTELELPVIISVNQTQLKNYSLIFSPQQLISDDDSLQVKGPLAAVLSIHLKYPHEDLLILACDMLLMKPDLLKELLTQYRQQENFDAFVYVNGSEPEPLCGIYKASGLNKIFHLYHLNQLSTHSMKNTLQHINLFAAPISDDKKKCFENFNTAEELNAL